MKKNCFAILLLCALISQITLAQTEPNALNDFDTADINAVLNVNAPGVLNNDTDVDGDTLTITSFRVNGIDFAAGETATFGEGSVIINSDGSYVFSPLNNYTGNVSAITYTLFDGTYNVTAYFFLTIENTTNLIDINVLESCNQGYTINDEYKVIYYMTIRNTSTARDYHTSSFIENLDLTNDLQTIFGNGCVTEISEVNITTLETTDYVDNPYPLNFNNSSINPDFLNLTSASIFDQNTIDNAILYPRQSINVRFCLTINPFCNGRPNPTPSGSGVDFDSVLNITSTKGSDTENISLTDFHTTEAVVTASLFIPENNPLANQDGTYDYNNRVIITNEGVTTANNINYNMGLSSFLDHGVIFNQIIVSQVSGPSVTIDSNYNGDTNSLLLTANNSLGPGETIILELFYLIDPISSVDTNYFYQLSRSQTQGSLDGFNETNSVYMRRYSFVTWSDSLGNHLDRYYATNSETGTTSSTAQCDCISSTMSFSFATSVSNNKIISSVIDAPNDIVEHQEITFQITVSNTSEAVELDNLQLQDDLNTICSGNIISVSTPFIQNSTATIDPILNMSYNGTTNVDFFNGTSGLLNINEVITIEFSVLFNEDCIGVNKAIFSTTDPIGNVVGAEASINVNASTDTDFDSVPNRTDIDDDNDTITDIDEYNGLNPLDDHDNDLIPNYRDSDFNIDANNDGIVDLFDFDNDGVPNHFDLDSDNDGIFDLDEVNNTVTSSDSDGMASTENVGDNGLHNDVEIDDNITTAINYTIPNTDNNGNANFIDIDADNDGIVDNIEAQTTDNYITPNGVVSEYGMDTAYPEGVSPIDTDNDTIFDYVDLNSDNDIRDDYIEGWDLNNDGTPETIALNVDTDNDGLDDAFDINDNLINPTNSQIPTDFPDVDNTDNPERDWREIIAIVVVMNDVTVNEAEDLVFTISLVTKNDNSIRIESASTISVNVSTVNGTDTANQYNIATSPYDYNAINTSFLNIPPNTETINFTVNSLEDVIYELDELFTINGTITSQNTINTELSGVGTIIDNDLPPDITMDNSQEEEGADLIHTITLSHPSSTPVNIDVATNDGVAISPNDYTAVSTNLIINETIDPNNANTQISFNIPTVIDNLNEPNEEILNVIGNVTSVNVSAQDLIKTAGILDIDPDPILEIDDIIVIEGEPLVFTFRLLNADLEPMQNYLPINFDIETFDETANRSLDYQPLLISSFIPANTEFITQTVLTIDDQLNENTETLQLQTAVTSVNISNTSSVLLNIGTIKDNDIPNLFSPNNDGDSDEFKISGIEDYPNFKLQIYDRWGSEMYNYNNNGRINPIWWNGNYNGKPAPAGVYYYTLNFNDNSTKPKTNFIQLIR